jgi:hypothetical protein
MKYKETQTLKVFEQKEHCMYMAEGEHSLSKLKQKIGVRVYHFTLKSKQNFEVDKLQ